jgi:L-asparaginase / beta-aspartyl-peptidase
MTEAPAMAIHGGAGDFDRRTLEPFLEREAREALAETLYRGMRLMEQGASAVEAVVLAVSLLEDAEPFNAGRGSVLTAEGRVEMDAAVMEGTWGMAGAVASISTLRNPVTGALLVMEKSPHVLLCGEAAERFAVMHGAVTAPQEYFITPRRMAQLRRCMHGEIEACRGEEFPGGGTVGAVARDGAGRLAAATSTGGIAGKLPGRIGDSPLIGSGTWAADAVCAVSATGDGELFIRCAFAHEIDAGIRLAGLDAATAAEMGLGQVSSLGGSGGCIVAPPRGEPFCRFTTSGMFRGTILAGGLPRVALFADEG